MVDFLVVNSIKKVKGCFLHRLMNQGINDIASKNSKVIQPINETSIKSSKCDYEVQRNY